MCCIVGFLSGVAVELLLTVGDDLAVGGHPLPSASAGR